MQVKRLTGIYRKYRKVHDKLCSTDGESLAEVMISTLFIALAMVMLASMVMASKNLIEKSGKNYSEDMAEANVIEGEASAGGKALETESGTLAVGPEDGTSLYMTDTKSTFKYSFLNRRISAPIVRYGAGGKYYTYK